MANELRVGVMGCGNISTTYFKYAPMFRSMKVTACADLNASLAEKRAAEYGITAMTPKAMLASPEVDIILNLTIPSAHYGVTQAALKAGKHVYTEKPLVLSMKEGLALQKLAKAKRVRIAAAPDTFLGSSHQLARKLLDDGAVGKITAGTAAIMSHGMEHWHPNPDFFFKPGGGPVLDMGPYYITNLVNLLGPVKRVAAFATMGTKTRTISSAPRAGDTIKVSTPTNVQGLLEFKSGATVTLLASWDVWSHRHGHMELYGTEGSLFLPDPNFFSGDVLITSRDSAPHAAPAWSHPFAPANEQHGEHSFANYRAAGLADFALSILSRKDARCSGDRALHVTEIMLSLLQAGKTGKFVTLKTSCTRPAPLGPDEARKLLR